MADTNFDFQSPGKALKCFLSENGWTQEDLAHILTISLKHTNEIIKDKKSISIDIAMLLGKVFKLDAYEWVMLDTKFQLSKKKEQKEQKKEELVEHQVEVYKYLPINELIKKGWLKPYDNIKALNKQLRSFFGIPKDKPLDFSALDLSNIDIEFRQSEAYKESSYDINAKAWHQMALNHSKKLNVDKYDKDGLKELMSRLHNYTFIPNGINKFLNDLGKVGVKFVFLSHLSKTYLDGAAFLSERNPVIALTGRYDRVDNFWFTISHEISHVLLHLSESSNNKVFMDNSKSTITSKKECEANKMAEKMLLQKQILAFFEEYIGYITEEKVNEFSSKYNIHPSIVVGILAFNEKISYSTSHRFKESVRDKIPRKYRVEQG